MAEENQDGQEKTEEPSQRKISKAKEDGKVLTSKEMFVFTGIVAMFGLVYILPYYSQILLSYWSMFFDWSDIVNDKKSIFDILFYGLRFFILVVIITSIPMFFIVVLTQIAVGGINFAPKAIQFKGKKINPIETDAFIAIGDNLERFNAFKNNAYGLSCENYQFAFFRPKIKSRYVFNLYYCGHTSCPGPGIPPSMISGLNASNLLIKDCQNKRNIFSSFFTEFWILITNLVVNIITFGFNVVGLKTTFSCFIKEFNFILFNKLKPSNYFRYE